MARASRETWVKRVERWRDSGLTAKEFAAELGVNAHTLSHWGWKLDREKTAPPAPARRRTSGRAEPRPEPQASAVELVEVSLPSAGYEVVTPSGWTVRLPSAFDAATVEELLRVAGAL